MGRVLLLSIRSFKIRQQWLLSNMISFSLPDPKVFHWPRGVHLPAEYQGRRTWNQLDSSWHSYHLWQRLGGLEPEELVKISCALFKKKQNKFWLLVLFPFNLGANQKAGTQRQGYDSLSLPALEPSGRPAGSGPLPPHRTNQTRGGVPASDGQHHRPEDSGAGVGQEETGTDGHPQE